MTIPIGDGDSVIRVVRDGTVPNRPVSSICAGHGLRCGTVVAGLVVTGMSTLTRPCPVGFIFCLVSAVPFGVLACTDEPWRSSDAAPVAAVAWTVVFGAHLLKYPDACPFLAYLLFFPLVLSALLGRGVGTLCHRGSTTWK